MRDAFAALVPSLANPVPQSCLNAIADPAGRMLGGRQYAAFTRAIRASTATWKVIVNEVPIQQYYALPYDRWEGYAAERERLLRFLQANVKNVLFLTTDTHANFVNEVRLSTLGGPARWGPGSGRCDRPRRHDRTEQGVDATLGRAGSARRSWRSSTSRSRRGVGMACASGNVYSYAQVQVTAAAITVTPKDQAGSS